MDINSARGIWERSDKWWGLGPIRVIRESNLIWRPYKPLARENGLERKMIMIILVLS